MKDRNKIIVAGIIACLFFFSLGLYLGVTSCINKVVDVGSRFIEIDYNAVYAALYQYQEMIGGCYAPLRTYEGNKTQN